MTDKRRLIVCDDEADFRSFVRKVAESAGYEVREVGSSRRCIAEVAVFQPDVIVLDMVMPEIDGIEIVQGLDKAAFAGRVIISSGYSPKYASAAAQLGELKGLKVDILPKPVQLATLRAAIV